jgi:hypothetical protein
MCARTLPADALQEGLTIALRKGKQQPQAGHENSVMPREFCAPYDVCMRQNASRWRCAAAPI